MKTLILYASSHHGNTKKVAHAIGKVLKAKTLSYKRLKSPRDILGYELIGLGSGVYWGNFDKNLLRLVDRFPSLKNKRAFVFSTSGRGEGFLNRFYLKIKDKLRRKGVRLLGDYNCRGFDTMGIFGLLGGLNKGHPDKTDLEEAADFAKKLTGPSLAEK